MKCQNCDEQQATIHLTEIENGVKKEIHLCEVCYQSEHNEIAQQSVASINKLVASIKDEAFTNEEEGPSCHVCGATYARFQKTGVFGCPQDYAEFRDTIIPLLKKVHGADTHTGKVPRRVTDNQDNAERLITLRRELENLVSSEMFERAAELRDEIRQLEESNS